MRDALTQANFHESYGGMSLDNGHPLVGCRTDSITATKVPVEAIRIRSISGCICERGKN